MSYAPSSEAFSSPSMEAYLLGRVDFQTCLALRRKLIDQLHLRDDGQTILLLCEHPPTVTVGRSATAGDVASGSRLLQNGQIEIHWVSRGGGAMVHCPGQLAIYPLVPLRWHGFSVGEFLERFEAGLLETLEQLNFPAGQHRPRHGLWGRTGQLVAMGVAVRHWVTYHGAFLNVNPAMGLFKLIQSDPFEHTRMSCLLAERRGVVRMPTVRATLVPHLANVFGCDRFHLYTGHPMLRRQQ